MHQTPTAQRRRLGAPFSSLRCPLGFLVIVLPVLFVSTLGQGSRPAWLFENADRGVPIVWLPWYQPPACICRTQHCDHQRRDRQRLENISHFPTPSVMVRNAPSAT